MSVLILGRHKWKSFQRRFGPFIKIESWIPERENHTSEPSDPPWLVPTINMDKARFYWWGTNTVNLSVFPPPSLPFSFLQKSNIIQSNNNKEYNQVNKNQIILFWWDLEPVLSGQLKRKVKNNIVVRSSKTNLSLKQRERQIPAFH